MRFVHSLFKTTIDHKNGWCSPIEVGEAAPQYISFVIPIDPKPDLIYLCVIVNIAEGDHLVSSIELVRKSNIRKSHPDSLTALDAFLRIIA